jgi:hypothetical protein
METPDMKHPIRTVACGVALLGAVACGSKQTMASKSAAAYDQATKKGIPIESGEHGGHSAEPATPTATPENRSMPAMDHEAMAGMDHAHMPAMDHSPMPGMQHSTAATGAHDMARMDHGAMAAMDHSKMPGMPHGGSGAVAHDMAAMVHSAMPGMAHGSTAGMQPGGSMAAMPGMQHESPAAAPMTLAPPTSNAEIAQTQPAATLRPDVFDAPAPTAIEEAAKGASGMSHPMEMTSPAPPPQQPPPQPQSTHHHHGVGEAS